MVMIDDFKDSQLASQIATNFSGVIHPRSHTAWKTSHKLTHPKISSQKTCLMPGFLRVGSRKRRFSFGDMISYFNPFKPHSGYYTFFINFSFKHRNLFVKLFFLRLPHLYWMQIHLQILLILKHSGRIAISSYDSARHIVCSEYGITTMHAPRTTHLHVV